MTSSAAGTCVGHVCRQEYEVHLCVSVQRCENGLAQACAECSAPPPPPPRAGVGAMAAPHSSIDQLPTCDSTTRKGLVISYLSASFQVESLVTRPRYAADHQVRTGGSMKIGGEETLGG